MATFAIFDDVKLSAAKMTRCSKCQELQSCELVFTCRVRDEEVEAKSTRNRGRGSGESTEMDYMETCYRSIDNKSICTNTQVCKSVEHGFTGRWYGYKYLWLLKCAWGGLCDNSWPARNSAGDAFISWGCNLKYLKPVCLIRWGVRGGGWDLCCLGETAFGAARRVAVCSRKVVDVDIWCFWAPKELPRRGCSSAESPEHRLSSMPGGSPALAGAASLRGCV